MYEVALKDIAAGDVTEGDGEANQPGIHYCWNRSVGRPTRHW